MNAALLLEHYARIADAPDAITKLRRFVLDLAVRGKLVEQDTGDEPAAELLKRISVERARLAKAGEIRKPKPLPAIDDPLFDLPFNWAWVPIREITSDRGQSIPAAPFTYIDVTAINKEAGVVAEPKVLLPTEAPSRARKITQKGDVIYSCVRPYLLNVAVIEQDFDPAPIASTAFAILNGYGLVLPRYIWIVLRTPFMIECVEATQRGQAYPAINDADFAVLSFPLPPLAEQHRIVAKVDELMALCDQLEAARAEREHRRDRFALSTLAKLNEPDPETFAKGARFALANLAPLTTRPDQIKQLRQTILNLAVRGKLVRQDAPDEPAANLFQRVQSEKARLAKAGIIPRPKESARDLDFLTEALPSSWLAIALGDVCNLVTSGSRGWGEFYADSGPGFIRAQNIRFGKLRLDGIACVNPPAKSEGARTQVAKGDLLIVITGAGVTNPALLDTDLGEAYVSQHVGLVRPCDPELSRWLLLCLMADAGGRAELIMRAYGAGKPGLNLDNIRSLSVPLAPLAEQHRILAKVDKLIALCDQLEASITSGEQTRSRLWEAVLHEALEPA